MAAPILERTQAAIADQLRPGEALLAAAKAQLDMRVMNAMRKDPSAGSWADAPGVVLTPPIGRESRDIVKTFATGVVIAVTNARVLLVDLTAIKHTPRLVMVSIDRDAIAHAQGGTRRVSFIKIRWLTLRVDTPSGPATLGFEVPKIAAREADRVLAELGIDGESAVDADSPSDDHGGSDDG